MKEQILKELRSIYNNIIFDFKKNAGYEFYLLYKDKDKENYMLSDEDEIIEKIENIVEKYLKDDELKELVVGYDYLNEISENTTLIHNSFNLEKEIEKNSLTEAFRSQNKYKEEITIDLNEINLEVKQMYKMKKNIKIEHKYKEKLNNDYEEMENELWVA